jgi:hypothetical protein
LLHWHFAPLLGGRILWYTVANDTYFHTHKRPPATAYLINQKLAQDVQVSTC